MTNEQLVALVQDHINEAENMLELWQQNRAFVYMLARRFSGCEELDDLMQVGYIGLCEAVSHYDGREGVQFINYAAFWIRQAMQRHIVNNRSPIRIPAHAAELVSKYNRMRSEFQKTYGREPRRDEIRSFLEISWEQLDNLEKAAVSADMRSLDAPMGEDGEFTMCDTVAASEDLEEGVLDRVQQEELEAVIWPLVDSLDGEQPAVIRMRYKDGKTLEESGQEIGYTREKARQLEAKALRNLRGYKYREKLKPFWEELALPAAYHGSVGSFERTWTSSTERAALLGCGMTNK